MSGTKYGASLEKTGLVRYMSVLSIHNTSMDDYGLYKCVAKNDLGQDEMDVNLVATSEYFTLLYRQLRGKRS